MTAAEHVGHGSPPAARDHPLAPGATPDVIRDHLLDDDRPLFDEALRRAEASADPGTLWDCIEHWRCVAVVQDDREDFVRLARRVAERNTGEASPADEDLRVTRAKAGI